MATVLPPVRNDISGTAPNPSNAVARTAFGVFYDFVINVLGSTGTPEGAADALGAFRRGTILGTVSQAAGVPTGALIETGSNANGEYFKYAGGMLVCKKSVAVASASVAAGATVNSALMAVTPVGDYVLLGNCSFFSTTGYGGNNLYSLTYSYTIDGICYLNTGQALQLVNPSFTMGATTALSYKINQILIGRWHA